MAPTPIKDDIRTAFRAYSMNIKKVPVKGMSPPCKASPLAMAVMANSRTP